jgi:hypothetical protein
MNYSFLHRITLALCLPLLCRGAAPLFGQAVPVRQARVDLRSLFHAHALPLSAGAPAFEGGTEVMVFLFLSPDCPLCRNYSMTLNQLYKQYGSNTRFYGIIPGKADLPAEINAFVNKYHIVFPLYRDPDLAVAKRLHAGVTPQAIVLNREGSCVYSGLIDDWVTDLGVQRSHVTRHFLQEALDAAEVGQRPLTGKTTPIGCLINAY